MNWKLAFQIAITHLITKPKQTVVAMMGVMFGISMFIIMISFMTGVNNFMEDMAMDGSPHIRIYNPLQVTEDKIIAQEVTGPDHWFVVHHQRPKNDLSKIKNALFIANEIEKLPQVQGVAPQVATQVFFNNGPIQISGTMSGIDVQKQKELFNLETKMDEGSLDNLLTSSDAIVMGKGLAEKVNVKIGDRVSVTTPEGNNLVLKVAGIFAYGMAAFDESKSYASIATVQKILMRDPSYITDLHIKLKDINEAKVFASTMHEQLNVYAEDWETANSSLLAGDKIRNTMTSVISFTLLLVAGFGIYNIMNMNIINKMKDIAILKATGFQGNDIIGIFLFQSLIIGILGGLLGILLGYGGCYLLSITPFPEAKFMRLKTLPVNFDAMFYMMGLGFGFITTLFAGYFPAKKASKIDPVRIIRG
jgi:lipoprotein-releasing system permease protein